MAALSVLAKDGPTLAAIKQRGSVNCGVFGVIPGFSLPDSKGVMRGFDADECRAVAAATLGNPEAVKWVMLTAHQRIPALQAGEVDVVYANLGWTMSREVQSGIAYASTYFYDGEAFMVKKSLGVKSAKDLNGVSVCLTQGSSLEQSVQEYFQKNKMTYKPVVFAGVSEARKAFVADRCDSTAGDASSLTGFKAGQGAAGDKFEVLPVRMTSSVLGGAVRKGDGQWFDIVRWTHYALVQAEAFGMTSENIDSFKTTKGRAETEIGAGVEGHNRGVIHICLIGGAGSAAPDPFGRDFTAAQDRALRGLIDAIRAETTITRITGHNDHAAKACPGFVVRNWINRA